MPHVEAGSAAASAEAPSPGGSAPLAGVVTSAGPAAFVPPAPSGSDAFVSRAIAAEPLGSEPLPRWKLVARTHPVLWMVLAPLTLALLMVVVLVAVAPDQPAQAEPSVAATSEAEAPAPVAAATDRSSEAVDPAAALTALEEKPYDALTVTELFTLHEGRSLRDRETARAFTRKLQAEPSLIKANGAQQQLLKWAAGGDTAREALAAMSVAEAPYGADLLYEVWVSRVVRPEVAELAGALLLRSELRAKASPPLGAALELRAAPSCEAALSALPQVERDGDRRSLQPLAKLSARRGCGPKKNQDCFACLRAHQKQVTAAANAVKARKAPSFVDP